MKYEAMQGSILFQLYARELNNITLDYSLVQQAVSTISIIKKSDFDFNKQDFQQHLDVRTTKHTN